MKTPGEKWPVACDSGGDTQRGGNGRDEGRDGDERSCATLEADTVNKMMKLNT